MHLAHVRDRRKIKNRFFLQLFIALDKLDRTIDRSIVRSNEQASERLRNLHLRYKSRNLDNDLCATATSGLTHVPSQGIRAAWRENPRVHAPRHISHTIRYDTYLPTYAGTCDRKNYAWTELECASERARACPGPVAPIDVNQPPLTFRFPQANLSQYIQIYMIYIYIYSLVFQIFE